MTGALPVEVPLSANPTLNIAGGDPAFPNLPGDTLSVPANSYVTPTGPGDGEVGTSAGTPQNVVTGYTSIENVIGGPYTLNVVTTNFAGVPSGNPDTTRLVLTDSGTVLDLYFNGTLEGEYTYSAVNSITVTGSTDPDTLVVDNSGGLIERAISFDGVAPGNGNTLTITGGTQVARETYVADSADPTAGTEILDPADTYGAGAVGATSANAYGVDEYISFVNLSPVITDTPAAIYDVILTTNGDDASITDTTIGAGGRQRDQ